MEKHRDQTNQNNFEKVGILTPSGFKITIKQWFSAGDSFAPSPPGDIWPCLEMF